MKSHVKTIIFYVTAILLAILSGMTKNSQIITLANLISDFFVGMLKWLSIPMIFLSILNTTSSLQNKAEFFSLSISIVKYTLLTTLIAASLGLFYFLIINPTNFQLAKDCSTFIAPSASNNFGIALISTISMTLLLSSVILTCDASIRKKIHLPIAKLYSGIMHVIQKTLLFMPVAIWAFVTLFIVDLNQTVFNSLLLYLTCILLANLSQAIIVLPIMLKLKNIPILESFQGMLPALITAFWSKSSSVALPVAIQCAEKNLNVSKKISGFSLPLCTTINMNACSAFILITVLFVSTSHGVVFSPYQAVLWVVIATIAAVGNAGVPMGCYTLSCAILSYMGVPLYLLGLILPFYSIIDMLESAINVWSDACVTLAVNQDYKLQHINTVAI